MQIFPRMLRKNVITLQVQNTDIAVRDSRCSATLELHTLRFPLGVNPPYDYPKKETHLSLNILSSSILPVIFGMGCRGRTGTIRSVNDIKLRDGPYCTKKTLL